jgi:hypothetical protein
MAWIVLPTPISSPSKTRPNFETPNYTPSFWNWYMLPSMVCGRLSTLLSPSSQYLENYLPKFKWGTFAVRIVYTNLGTSTRVIPSFVHTSVTTEIN